MTETTKRTIKKTVRVAVAGLILRGAIATGQTAAPVPPANPCASTPAPAQKKCGWLCQKIEAEKLRLEIAAQQKVNKEAAKLGKETKGTVDGSALPSMHDGAGAAPKATAKPCPAIPKPLTPAPPAPPAAPATVEPS